MERGIGGLVDVEERFLEDGMRGFVQGEKPREIVGEFFAVAGLGVEADEFGRCGRGRAGQVEFAGEEKRIARARAKSG